MERNDRLVLLLLLLGAFATFPAPAAQTADSDVERQFAQSVRPFVTRYCSGCHSGNTPAAGLDLRSYATVASVVQDFAHWSLVSDKLTAKETPPKPAPQPAAD